MRLSPSGRLLHAALAALLCWPLALAVRADDTFAVVTYALVALMFALPAAFGRDTFGAHRVPYPRWLRWMYADDDATGGGADARRVRS